MIIALLVCRLHLLFLEGNSALNISEDMGRNVLCNYFISVIFHLHLMIDVLLVDHSMNHFLIDVVGVVLKVSSIIGSLLRFNEFAEVFTSERIRYWWIWIWIWISCDVEWTFSKIMAWIIWFSIVFSHGFDLVLLHRIVDWTISLILLVNALIVILWIFLLLVELLAVFFNDYWLQLLMYRSIGFNEFDDRLSISIESLILHNYIVCISALKPQGIKVHRQVNLPVFCRFPFNFLFFSADFHVFVFNTSSILFWINLNFLFTLPPWINPIWSCH